VALAIDSPWTTTGDRRRQVIVVWTDQPAQPLDASVLPADLSSRVPADFSALTDVWEDEQGPMGSSSKRLILSRRTGLVGATSLASGRTWCIIRHRLAVGTPRLTTERSSTRSAIRCERSNERMVGVGPDQVAGFVSGRSDGGSTCWRWTTSRGTSDCWTPSWSGRLSVSTAASGEEVVELLTRRSPILRCSTSLCPAWTGTRSAEGFVTIRQQRSSRWS
jgi:hypothetical protein